MQLNDYKIPGTGLKVTGNLELRTEDIAGETSGTDSVEKGIKPKVLQVSLQIPYLRPNDLSSLIKIAEAKKKGSRVIYMITDKTANFAGIREVQFAEHFNWKENGSLQLWDVSFSLREYLSNSQRKEEREEVKKTLKQGAAGKRTKSTNHGKILKQAAKQ